MSWLRRLLTGWDDIPEPPRPTGEAGRVADVQSVLDELRPLFTADGGDVHLLAVDEGGWVTVRLVGACERCAMSDATVHAALEPKLRRRCSWFAGVRVG